ncbi:MAG: Protoporphyrinogen IX oxidase, novel form, HemJ [uncultured Acetobacteraceae bacterium]|jgi:putative membrane protein|uniref:Protoporphyrinogen IX oxidase n=1 Tax=uncultured Acetobacteraceae bacterium TaxID=169975 RepID=A0A6J4JVW2_9PROT|nr:MAG: Protoporphyrinogen IX oxidase, novel form, HemJ [uncultured Acetobacteraceae bacterium]
MTFGALAPLYPWTKALHLIAVFAWMAGLFYLPRLYVYHTAAAPGSESSELFKTMERRLLRAIMNPAMIAAWALGLTLVLTPGVVDWRAGWWHGKAAGFLAMTAIHMHLAAARRGFEADRRDRTGRYWRIMNEAPTLLLALIVVMVIVKPGLGR